MKRTAASRIGAERAPLHTIAEGRYVVMVMNWMTRQWRGGQLSEDEEAAVLADYRAHMKSALPRLQESYAATSAGSSPTSIGLFSGSLLHSNQPPSYTATFCQPISSA